MKRIFTSVMCLTLVFMTACKDGKAEEEAAAKMEQEKMDQENADNETAMQEEAMREAQENSIASKAMATESLSTLVAAVKAADLATMLSEPGDYTVFAPNNAAFDKLPAGTVETLLKPENKEQLKGILTYHVVPSKVDANTLIAAINDSDGKYVVKTANGGELTATLSGESVILTDASGNKSTIIATDVQASNGVVHIIDTVVMPKA
ncbi:fasciclin domain-containing protein [Subsaximicrobium wynnwilliamsii]|uniref:Fasciclin domain-containing protein n=2 Tax=Subsaximicrobium wynnwilliamsii TaxID=291179 RepID=A0A5C6ZIH7_9FLAO|nr:fasciclin domain-containing protein [Subsaximicrobium wynnwilliamsii]TXD89304.1 fasciclin domain-containing protein [Subsaximicrobium wynnwilliamsii]TXE03235.1 fasciclin domain-containing protein [Subsaximicrobium wynnwilliamsii]